VKALVISDQPLTVIALLSVLRHADPEADLFDATHLGEALRTLSDQGPFDFIVLDLDTHGVKRVSGAALLRQMWPGVPLALISESQHEQDVRRSVDIGATGYLLKTDTTEVLSDAVARMLPARHELPELLHA
jgi:DNA-binding NarL/FixJ family response regulator